MEGPGLLWRHHCMVYSDRFSQRPAGPGASTDDVLANLPGAPATAARAELGRLGAED